MVGQNTQINPVISREKPPAHIYDRAVKEFGIDFDKGTIFTMGHTIHSKFDMADDLLEHELVHTNQQLKMGIEIWWEKYFDDPHFRLQQEIEAYQVQYRWIERHNTGRDAREYYLNAFAGFLSGKMYGSLLTFNEAVDIIKKALTTQE